MTKRHLICLAALATLSVACIQEEGRIGRQPEEGAKPGGTLVVAITEPASIEPSSANVFESAGFQVIRTMCDALGQYDPVDGTLKPALAESWLTAEEGSVTSVKLRRKMQFPGGKEVVADDAHYSLSRVAQRDYGSPVATLLEPVFGFDNVHGELDLQAEEDINERYLKELIGTLPQEKYSIQLRTTLRRGDFVHILGHPLASAVPKDLPDRDPTSFAKKPVCAGPYQMAEPWTPGDPAIRLVRFDKYYGRNDGYTRGGKGWADAIDFRIYADHNAAFDAYVAGTVDVAPVPPDRVAQARTMGDDLVVATTPTLEYIGLPTAQEPFNNPRVRRALSLALNRQAINESVYGGLRTPATSYLPPGLGPYYRQDSCSEMAPAAGDVEAARATLAESGVDLNGRTFNLYFNDELGNRALVTAVAAQWTDVFGAQFQLQSLGWDQYLDRADGTPGFDGPFRMGWAPSYPSADQVLDPLFSSSSIGSSNFARFSNRLFDRALERRARRQEVPEDLYTEYQRLEELACANTPIVPVVFGSKTHVVRKAKLDSAVGVYADITNGEVILRELFLK